MVFTIAAELEDGALWALRVTEGTQCLAVDFEQCVVLLKRLSGPRFRHEPHQELFGALSVAPWGKPDTMSNTQMVRVHDESRAAKCREVHHFGRDHRAGSRELLNPGPDLLRAVPG